MENKIITFRLTLTNPQGKMFNGFVMIGDGFAISTFDDSSLAKKQVQNEIDHGNKNIFYKKKANAMVENFTGMKKEEILKKIKEQIEKVGGKLQQL